ncbi:hypothetical protein EG68_05910 [Paragonimus skrjabini miyazakii]|uniref:GRIP domain-containing protein n=1 Tax=Paragonimus skrjabini miyazakii TaxID=59628 RepID=A0A8S9YBA3_9TREM|nr:hypothetical protein EG68_05910 [Paragonimus skrjabini miyazakii]
MFHKLKENVAKSDKNRIAIKIVDVGGTNSCCLCAATEHTASNKTRAERTRTSSTTSHSSQISSSTTGFESVQLSSNPNAGNEPAVLHLIDPAFDFAELDSASVISSVCQSGSDLGDLQARFKHVHQLARGFKTKYKQVTEKCKQLEKERDQLQELLDSSQTRAFRRIDELREQVDLDKKAKQDVEVNYNLMLNEKDEFIQVLRLQVSLLKEGKDLPPELEEKINAGHERELKRQRSLERENQELKSQLSSTLTESDCLRRELTDSRLAQAAMEEQIQVLNSQLLLTSNVVLDSDMVVVATTNDKELGVPSTSESVLRESELDGELHRLTEQLQQMREQLLAKESELDQLRLQTTIGDKVQNRMLVERLVMYTGKETESDECGNLKRLSLERTSELTSCQQTLELSRIREGDLADELGDTKARLMNIEAQLEDAQSQLEAMLNIRNEYLTLKERLQRTDEREQLNCTRLRELIIQHVWASDVELENQPIERIIDETCLLLRDLVSQADKTKEELKNTTESFERNKRHHEEEIHQLSKAYEATTKSLQTTLSHERELTEELKRQLDISASESSELREQCTHVRSELAHFENCAVNAKNALSELQTKYSTLESDTQIQLQSLRDILEAEKLEHQSTRCSMELLEREKNELSDKLVSLTRQFETEHSQMSTAMAEITEDLERTHQRLAAAETLVSTYLHIGRELSELRQHCSDVQTLLGQLRTEWKAIVATVSHALQEDADQLIDRLEHWYSEGLNVWNEDRMELQTQLCSLKNRLRQTSNDLQEARLQHSICESQFAAYKACIKELESRLEPSVVERSAEELVKAKLLQADQSAELTSLHHRLHDVPSDLHSNVANEGRVEFLSMDIPAKQTSAEPLREEETAMFTEMLQHEMNSWKLWTKQSIEAMVVQQRQKLTSLSDLVNSSMGRLTQIEQALDCMQKSQEQQCQTKLLLTASEDRNQELIRQLSDGTYRICSLESELAETLDRSRRWEFANSEKIATLVHCIQTLLRSLTARVRDESFQTVFPGHHPVTIDTTVTDIETVMVEVDKLMQTEDISKVLHPLIERIQPIIPQSLYLISTLDDRSRQICDSYQRTFAELQRLISENASSLGMQSMLKVKLDEAQLELASLHDSHRIDSEKIASLESSLSVASEQLEELRAQALHAQTSMNKKEKEKLEALRSCAQQNQDLKSSLADATTLIANKEAEVTAMGTDVTELTTKLSALRTAYLNTFERTVDVQLNSLKTRLERVQQDFVNIAITEGDPLSEQIQLVERSILAIRVPDFTVSPSSCSFVEDLVRIENTLNSLSQDVHDRLVASRSVELDRQITIRTNQLKEDYQMTELRCKQLMQDLEQSKTELNALQLVRAEEANKYRESELSMSAHMTEMENRLSKVQTALVEQSRLVQTKSDLVFSMELQLQEFQSLQRSTEERLSDKEQELKRQIEALSLAENERADLLQKLQLSQSNHQRVQDHLTEVLQSVEEQKQKLEQSYQSQLDAMESVANAREKQYKQQLKDVKARLKQVLQDSENLRKSTQSATTREQHLSAQLVSVEAELEQQRIECEHLRENIEQMKLDQVTVLGQSLPVAASQTVESLAQCHPESHDLSENVREDLRDELESLKAEHAVHVHEMREDFDQQLRTCELKLRKTFEEELALIQSNNALLCQSLETDLTDLRRLLKTTQEENQLLQSHVARLKEERDDEQKLKLSGDHVMSTPRILVDKSTEIQLDEFISPDTNGGSDSVTHTALPFHSDGGFRTSRPLFEKQLASSELKLVKPQVHLTRQTSAPPEDLILARPTGWMEQLRTEILSAESIDSLHPAVRSGHYVNPVSSQDYEALQLHNADLQNQLQQLAADFEALRSHCSACNGSHSVSDVGSRHYPAIGFPYSPSASPSTGSFHDFVENEYLKNVLFEYMMGRETMTLSKVLCSILRFSPDQTKRILQHEDAKARTWVLQAVMN